LGTKTAFTCDFCEGLDQPKCVELCPKQALSFAPLDAVGFSSAIAAAGRLIAEDSK
jgi:Fe-S-cluster-containing hydrogenase component 2